MTVFALNMRAINSDHSEPQCYSSRKYSRDQSKSKRPVDGEGWVEGSSASAILGAGVAVVSTSPSPMRLHQRSSHTRQVVDYILWMMPNNTGYLISMATGKQTCPNLYDSFERRTMFKHIRPPHDVGRLETSRFEQLRLTTVCLAMRRITLTGRGKDGKL